MTWLLSNVTDLPWWADFGFTPAVIAFAAAAAARTGAAMIVAQVAISVAFLSVVGVLSTALFGFDYEKYSIAGADVLVSQVYMGGPPAGELSGAADRREVYRRHYERSRREFERIAGRLRETPEVMHVTFASHFPGNDVEAARIEIAAGAGPGEAVVTRFASVGPDFFATLGARVVHGRDFDFRDHSGAPRTVVVNEPFARKRFRGGNAIGHRLRLADDEGAPGAWLEIVGVVPDLALNPGDPSRADGVYVPFRPYPFARIAVRTQGDPRAVIARLHEIVRREQPNAQVQSAETLEAMMTTAGSIFRGLGAGLLSVGVSALVLSAVSIYALVSFGVAQRTKEIGIRVAVGARPRHILRAVLQREIGLLVAGASLGLVLGLGLYRVVETIPFDLQPAGPSLALAFILLIVLAGGVACVIPARRALRTDPLEALRHT